MPAGLNVNHVSVTIGLIFMATAFERADEAILPACFGEINLQLWTCLYIHQTQKHLQFLLFFLKKITAKCIKRCTLQVN